MFPQIFGKYVLEREIAAGGMARVYLATLRGAVGFEKRLVVKQIRPELASDEGFVQRFVEEAKTAVELSHPNIVPVYELGVEQGIYYMAMEFCEGLTLAEILNETGPLDPEEGAYVGVEICRALDYAHRRANIVHRDVTPRNVLVDDEGAVRLIDFGIAAPAARSDEPKRTAREVFGSPGHMPPEQLRGERLTPATDVFAVGVLLIEAWTGRPPFRRASFAESAEALKTPPEPVDAHEPRLSPLVDIISSAIALDPARRPEHAETLSRRLRDFLRGADVGDIARRLGSRVRRARRRSLSSHPWLSGTTGSSGPLTPPLTPPGTPPITRTFAAREDVAEWTRRIPSLGPSSHPPAERKSVETPLIPPPAKTPEPETPEREAPSGEAANGAGETPPISSSSAPVERGRGRGALLGLGAVGLGALIFVLARGEAQPHASPAPPRPVASSAPSEPERPVEPPAPPAPEPRRDPAPEPAPSGVRPAPVVRSATPRGVAPAKADAGTEPSAQSTLKLTADLPAVVTVRGSGVSETRPTPVRALRVPAGTYTVTFSSETYSTPVSTRIVLERGASRAVHADFRDAVPRVSVR